VFVALDIQPAMCMRHIVICGLPSSTIFFHFICRRHDFLEIVIEHKMCVLILSTNSVWNVSHSKKNWARYDKKKYVELHVKYLLFLSDFNKPWIFWKNFRKIFTYKIPWISIQWELNCSMRTDKRTDMIKLIVAFRKFAKASKAASPESW